MEQHWWRVIWYLDLVAKNGIVLSPEKFEFCSHEIDFAGFQISDTETSPVMPTGSTLVDLGLLSRPF